jgi:hypothetical protein
MSWGGRGECRPYDCQYEDCGGLGSHPCVGCGGLANSSASVNGQVFRVWVVISKLFNVTPRRSHCCVAAFPESHLLDGSILQQPAVSRNNMHSIVIADTSQGQTCS